jgi:hypothetical protein
VYAAAVWVVIRACPAGGGKEINDAPMVTPAA